MGYQESSLEIKKVKLEKGTKATAWTPALADLSSTIKAVEVSATEAAKQGVTDAVELSFKNYLGMNVNDALGSKYAISPYIKGGSIDIATSIANNQTRVIIEPNENEAGIFQIYDKDGGSVISVKFDGQSLFRGKMTVLAGSTIAGLSITESSFVLGDFGKENSFYLSPQGHSNNNGADGYFGNYNLNDQWAISVGKNFGVTTDGFLYTRGGSLLFGKNAKRLPKDGNDSNFICLEGTEFDFDGKTL
jgi:hypothetical protein